jgi:iron complex outermembrane receptor protein
MPRHVLRAPRLLCLCGALVGATASAQPTAPAPAGAASAPEGQRVEVTGGRGSDTEQRRRATAAKIVVGREEIERQGDSTLGEILKRLPGVTVDGTPGRGGAPRMRGLGSGFTLILVDGERVPPGFSLDSIAPEQIERIEILRAPTAETGARAIAGTINIVLREGLRRRLNDVRLTLGLENGRAQPNAAWTRNDALGERWTGSFTLTGFRSDRDTAWRVETPARGLAEQLLRRDTREGVNANGRLQWRGEGGNAFTLSPLLIASRSEAVRRSDLAGDPAYDHSDTAGDGGFRLARLHALWLQRLPDGTRLEWKGSVAEAQWRNDSTRREFAGGALQRTLDEHTDAEDRSAMAGLKASRTLDSDHQLVAGAEAETHRREDVRRTLQDGAPVQGLAEFGDNVSASSSRWAVYVQDEWQATPRWALHAGLRGEGITTKGGESGRNRSAVWTPLLHALWKPDPAARDQVRLSLTRSWRAPPLQQLIARPTLSLRPNSATTPDRAGNPGLRPELATGLDLAFERYLEHGGVLSANVFHRSIRDVLRTQTALEDVPWSATPRWVARPRNIGDAVSQGVELEAKFRLDRALAGAPPMDMRANASVFRSRVKGVAGPDNRLDRQPDGTLNLGADWRIPRTPVTLGGSFNLTPGYATRLSDTQTAELGRKRQFDAYALWTLRPGLALRLSASNLAPEDQRSTDTVDGELERTTTTTYVNWALRLEAKL